MNITIKFGSLLRDKIGDKVIVETNKNELNLSEFRELIKKQPWGEDVFDVNHLKSMIILIIDNKLIKLGNESNNTKSKLIINSSSDINFQVMFAGGS